MRQDDLLFIRAGKCLMPKAEAVIVQRASSQEMLHVNICLGGEREDSAAVHRSARETTGQQERKSRQRFQPAVPPQRSSCNRSPTHTSAGAGSAHGRHARLCVGLQSYRMCEESGHSKITPADAAETLVRVRLSTPEFNALAKRSQGPHKGSPSKSRTHPRRTTARHEHAGAADKARANRELPPAMGNYAQRACK